MMKDQANQGIDMGQKEFRKVLEEKVNQTLSAKLSGKFKAIVAPNGIHWATTYGAMSYCNPNTLKDVDRMVVFDGEGNARFGDETFSKLYLNILENIEYQYSSDEKRELADLEAKANLGKAALVKAYEEDVEDIKDVKHPLREIINFADQHINDKNFSTMYPSFSAKYSSFLYDNNRYVGKISRENQAINYRDLLIDHLKHPSKDNAGAQVDQDKFEVAYTLPDVGRLFNDISSKDSKISIALNFTHFSEHQSNLSIDQQAGFVVPSGVFVIGKADTKYSLNSLTTESSSVSMNMEFKGITAFEAPPVMISTDGTKGWYDMNVLKEVADNTDNDKTGYYLSNKEFSISELFGEEKRFNRLGEFIISQDPDIEIQITNYNRNMVESCFQISSELSLDFFGFAISKSHHNYSVRDCNFDEDRQVVTVKLSAPVPEMSTDMVDKIGYLLGGVIVYPPKA